MPDGGVERPEALLRCSDCANGQSHMKKAATCSAMAGKIDGNHLGACRRQCCDKIRNICNARSPAMRHEIALAYSDRTTVDPIGMRATSTGNPQRERLR